GKHLRCRWLEGPGGALRGLPRQIADARRDDGKERVGLEPLTPPSNAGAPGLGAQGPVRCTQAVRISPAGLPRSAVRHCAPEIWRVRPVRTVARRYRRLPEEEAVRLQDRLDRGRPWQKPWPAGGGAVLSCFLH